MQKQLTWNDKGFSVNGVPIPFISGEFHYFRVPHKDWRFRLNKLKESGANAVATYIPWIIHEPEEGNIVFDDCPQRNLTEFLQLCRELEFMVIARPGPYQYAELRNYGIPDWMVANYSESFAQRRNGEKISTESFSYIHPVFLEKARKYIKAADDIIRPFLSTNGGPVVMIQIDNEIAGQQVWAGSIDYHPVSMGYGVEDGLYPKFLKEKFGTIEELNSAYGTKFSKFTDIDPRKDAPDTKTVEGKRFATDNFRFYCRTLEIFAKTVADWFEEDGLDVPYCINAASVNELPLIHNLSKVTSRENKPTLMAVDHYYTLGTHWGWGCGPSPLWYLSWMTSLDMLRELGQPPTLMEMQGGNLGDFPPMLSEELDAFYMTEEALGLKGSNYYIFTGGKNFNNTGSTAEVYDYQAAIGADNEIRPHYYSQKRRNLFAAEHSWKQTVDRSACVQIGFTWEQRVTGDRYMSRFGRDGVKVNYYTEDIQFPFVGSGYAPRFVEIGNLCDTEKLLLMPNDGRMSAEKQQKIVDFLENGGKMIITPFIPTEDEDFKPCTVLKDYLGIEGDLVRLQGEGIKLVNGTQIYGNTRLYELPEMEDWEKLVVGRDTGKGVAIKKNVGKGAVIWLGLTLSYRYFSQNKLVEFLCQSLDHEPLIKTDNYTVFASVIEDGEHGICFISNLLGGKQKVNISAKINGKMHDFGEVEVPAMSVVALNIDDYF